ncbi:MAG: hypothetical protein H6556_07320 [Lewinellaceae bacterium]|nr:hypothetical protein [Lewinellaceae bacterium]
MIIRLFTFLAIAGIALPLRALVPPDAIRGELAVSRLAFPRSTRLGPHTIRVPFELAGRLIVVEAAAEGLLGNFIIDTGSSKLILNAIHYKGGISPSQLASVGTTGEVEEVNVRPARSLSWSSLSFEKIQAHLIDLSHIEGKKNIRVLGLIGYEVLKDYELLIDFQLQQITLTRLDDSGERLDSLAILEEPEDSLDFHLKGHVITLQGWVDKTPVQFGLDSGAELNLLHSRVKRKVLNHFQISRRVNLNGMGGGEVEVLAGKLYRFRFNDRIRCSGMRTLLSNLDDINASFGTNLQGLIGYEFLCLRRTIINYKKEKLYFLKWYRP